MEAATPLLCSALFSSATRQSPVALHILFLLLLVYLPEPVSRYLVRANPPLPPDVNWSNYGAIDPPAPALIDWFPMGSLASFLVIYVLGGLTFFPLLLSSILIYVYLTLPNAPTARTPYAHDEVQRPDDDEYSLKSGTGTDQLAEKFHRTHESDVAAGYFAVCREYVPGGVNGKPPERTTPAGEVVAAESPSVYQAMYRSLFDRKQTPSIEPAKTNGKNTKRARNVFYIVLRYDLHLSHTTMK